MITIILILLAFVAFFICAITLFENSTVGWVWIILCVLSIVSVIISSTCRDFELRTWRNDLENLKDGTFIEGKISLILGSGEGEVKEEFYYTMYIRTKNGAKYVKLPLDKCEIVYQERPQIKTFLKVPKAPNDWRKYFYVGESESVIKYQLLVPRNSIDGKFELDAR